MLVACKIKLGYELLGQCGGKVKETGTSVAASIKLYIRASSFDFLRYSIEYTLNFTHQI